MAASPFSNIKLQHLLEMAKDSQVSDRAFRLLSYLALAHSDHLTGESYPSDKYVADAMGRSEKTVSRAARDLAESGRYEVERGVNRGRATHYRPTPATLASAEEKRKKADKVVVLSGQKARLNCLQSPTDVSAKALQGWGANKEHKFKTEHAQVRTSPQSNGEDLAAFIANLRAGCPDAVATMRDAPNLARRLLDDGDVTKAELESWWISYAA